MSQFMNLSESEEWPESQSNVGTCLFERIFDEQLFLVMEEEKGLVQHYTSYPVCNHRISVTIHIDYVLVAARFVVILSVTSDS